MPERRIYSFIEARGLRRLERELNRAVEDGWQFVELRIASSFFGHHYIIVLRRPI